MRIHEDYINAKIQPCFLDKQDSYLIDEFYNNFPSMGKIGILLDRTPSFFSAISVEGNPNEVIGVINQETGKLAAAAVISLRKVYFNGGVSTIGYISSLRIKPKYRGTDVFDLMYHQLYLLSQQHHVYIYFVSVYESNKRIRLSISHARDNRTLFKPIGKFYTAIFKSLKISDCGQKNNLTFERLQKNELEPFIEFLNKTQSQYTLSQHYRLDDFINSNGIFHQLQLENILLAKDNSEIVGSIALWDQRSFRKWKVTHYSQELKIARPVINLWQKLIGKPDFPELNQTIPYKSISLFKFNSNDIAIELLNNVIPYRAGKNYYAIGLYENSSLLELLRKSSIILENILLFSYWPESQNIINDIKIKRVELELATL